MASANAPTFGLSEQGRIDMDHRLIRAHHVRLLGQAEIREQNVVTTVCPFRSAVDDSTCWHCDQQAAVQPGSIGALLKNLITPQVEATARTATPIINATNNMSRPQFQTTPSTVGQIINTSNNQQVGNMSRPQFQVTPTTVNTGRTYATYLPSIGDLGSTTPSQPRHLATPTSIQTPHQRLDQRVQKQGQPRSATSKKSRASTSSTAAAAAAAALAHLTENPQTPIVYTELPVSPDFQPVHVAEPFRFLDLPIESRKRIYALLVVNHGRGVLLTKGERHNFQAGITRVNRQIRKESIDMVYTMNAFIACSRELTKIGPLFAREVGDGKLRLIRFWHWYTASRDLWIFFDEHGRDYEVRWNGTNGEFSAMAGERAEEVRKLLAGREASKTGIDLDMLRQIMAIVLRITPKKAKADKGNGGDQAGAGQGDAGQAGAVQAQYEYHAEPASAQ